MNPPIIGLVTGPVNAPEAKMQMAYDRGIGSHISLSAPPTIARGAEAAKPPTKRLNMIVVTFLAKATGIWNKLKIA